MSNGPTQRDQDEVCYRKDGEKHAGSYRARLEPRTTPVYYRTTLPDFRTLEALIAELRYRSRAEFFREAVGLTSVIAKAAKELGYDRQELLRRALEALLAFERKGPLPDWAHLEGVSGLQVGSPTDQPVR